MLHAQGAAAVADPRLPADTATGTWVILAEDGTWHRQLTTLELAVLQGLPALRPDGTPLVLAGQSHSAWRKRIGNAVPPAAAEAVATAMLTTLIAGTQHLLLWNALSPLEEGWCLAAGSELANAPAPQPVDPNMIAGRGQHGQICHQQPPRKGYAVVPR